MAIMCTAAEGIERRLEFDYFGFPLARREYFRPEAPGDGPDAYLVEQSPGSIVRPHFHRVDQFQVIVEGGGTLGRKPVESVTAHYADAFTGYGPIVAAESGLFYFTLRPDYDAGANYLPEERESQRRVEGGRRHRLSRHVDVASEEALGSLDVGREEPLLDTEPDGLAMSQLHVPPGAAVEVPPSEHGVYLLLLAGGLHAPGGSFGPWSVLWYGAGELPDGLTAGPSGAQLLHLRFPVPRVPAD